MNNPIKNNINNVCQNTLTQTSVADTQNNHTYVAKWPDENGYIDWSDNENQTWNKLITRQYKIIQNRACDEFIAGLEYLNLTTDRIPQLNEINQSLTNTGWAVQAVDGTIQVKEFFSMLKNKIFPVANFIRIPAQIDYLSQPDVFHEIFGHIPLLLNPIYAEFMQWYGEYALTLGKNARKLLGRLFWYSIEFGLINTDKGLRILGGGILSSYQETLSCLGHDPMITPQHLNFDIQKILQTDYDYTVIQDNYFILENIQQLFTLMNTKDLTNLLKNNIDPNDNNTEINC